MSDRNMKELVGVNLTENGKKRLGIMSQWLYDKGLISEPTFAAAARWNFDLGFTIFKFVNMEEAKGNIVQNLVLPINSLVSKTVKEDIEQIQEEIEAY